MARLSPLQSVWRSWSFILAASFLGSVLAVALSLIQPLQYASSIRLLITQPASTSLDAYTVLKSNERIAQSLSQLIYTSTFFENILSQAKGVNIAYFPQDEYDRRKLWQKTVTTGVEPNSGLMTVTIYHAERSQARALVLAAADELTKQAPNYFGLSVRLQVIDAPLDSRWFARPDFLTNAFSGLILGFLVGIGWVVVRKQE